MSSAHFLIQQPHGSLWFGPQEEGMWPDYSWPSTYQQSRGLLPTGPHPLNRPSLPLLTGVYCLSGPWTGPRTVWASYMCEHLLCIKYTARCWGWGGYSRHSLCLSEFLAETEIKAITTQRISYNLMMATGDLSCKREVGWASWRKQ